MKEITFFGIFLQLISIILSMISPGALTDNMIFYYLIMIILIVVTFIFMINVKDLNFLVSMFILSYFSVNYLAVCPSIVYLLIYIIGFILTCLYGYFYIFNNAEKQANIIFNKIELPKHKDYLIFKYMTGLPFKYLGNGIIYIKDDKLILEIESDKVEKIYKTEISKQQLKSISSKVVPYIVSKEKMLSREIDYTKAHFTNYNITDQENSLYTKDIKPIKSYRLDILLNDNTKIELITFTDPEHFFK